MEALLDREADELTPACIKHAKTRDIRRRFGHRPKKPQKSRRRHAQLVHNRTHQRLSTFWMTAIVRLFVRFSEG
jgi:hypothetical protein